MNNKYKNLTEGSVLSNLLRLAFPLMGTSFLQMAYNLLTMAWVGRLTASAGNYNNAIGAIAILMWLTGAIGLLGMIGSEISIGQSIGRKRLQRARTYASTTTTLTLIISVLWGLFVYIKAPFLLSFHHLDEQILGEAIQFLRIIVFIIPFQFLTYTFVGVYNGAGRSSIPFRFMAIGLITNMVIDPILMFKTEIFGVSCGFGIGFDGAAIGTIIAQFIVFLLFFYQLKVKHGIIGKYPLLIKPKLLYVKKIFFLGLPVSLTSALFAIINFVLAGVASRFDPKNGVTSQTTGGQIEGVTWNTAQGFSTALSAFVSQNYAAKKIDRGFQAYKYTLCILLALGVIVSMSFIFCGEFIFSVIVPKEDAVRAGAVYLGIMGFAQVFMMLEISSQGMFNGVGRTLEPAIISIIFNAIRIPLAIFLSSQLPTEYAILGVWWAIVISSICKGTILPVWFYFIYKKIRRKQLALA